MLMKVQVQRDERLHHAHGHGRVHEGAHVAPHTEQRESQAALLQQQTWLAQPLRRHHRLPMSQRQRTLQPPLQLQLTAACAAHPSLAPVPKRQVNQR